jgi:hypothetical protein
MKFKVNLIQRSRSLDVQNIKQDCYLLDRAVRSRGSLPGDRNVKSDFR